MVRGLQSMPSPPFYLLSTNALLSRSERKRTSSFNAVICFKLSRGEMSKVGHKAQQLSCLVDCERPWVRVPVGPRFFLPCDIWWLNVGPRLGPRASKVHVSLVPPWFRADSGTNLIKQGEYKRSTKWLNCSVV